MSSVSVSVSATLMASKPMEGGGSSSSWRMKGREDVGREMVIGLPDSVTAMPKISTLSELYPC